ncbi:MAG TPA: hypothetical protein VHE82_03175 [Gemmatimonadaceae bacterium]|nr:hypothetical protein [Gemmatimonadaceae bacterium]
MTLSRPRIFGSVVDESVDCAVLFAPALRVLDPDDFFPDAVRVTVDDDVVTSVVVESVSTRGVATCGAVEEAVAVSAADSAGLQAATITTAANAPARKSFVIDRFLV